MCGGSASFKLGKDGHWPVVLVEGMPLHSHYKRRFTTTMPAPVRWQKYYLMVDSAQLTDVFLTDGFVSGIAVDFAQTEEHARPGGSDPLTGSG